jgi:fibronectin-binding autotransporter adhesin
MRIVQFAVLMVALFILGSMVSIPLAHAATCTWDGSNSTWETAAHWSCGHVPVSGDNVVIPSGTVTVTANENIGSGGISNRGTLFVNSGVSLSFVSLDNSSGGTLTNHGTITTTGYGIDNSSGGTITNSGTITITPSITSYGIDNAVGGTITNSGTITITGYGIDNSSGGTITNSGTITITGSMTGYGIDNTSGTITKYCGGTITFSPAAGTLYGPGTLYGNPIIIKTCPAVGGEVLSLDYGSLMFSAVPWILIIATLATAGAIIFRQKFKLLL